LEKFPKSQKARASPGCLFVVKKYLFLYKYIEVHGVTSTVPVPIAATGLLAPTSLLPLVG
jgi:hypothetical protein